MGKNHTPSWLHSPPVQLDQPPIVKKEQGLPFNQLFWPDFERLILRVVTADQEILDCRVYGTPGQAQHGIDLLATQFDKPDQQTCYQCKKVEKFSSFDISKAINKFEEGPWVSKVNSFILCTACPLESTDITEKIVEERSRLSKKNITLHVWDGSLSGELNVKLKQMPEIVDDFFGREWVRIFNGEEASQQLAERLDGYDFVALRRRLSDLYHVIFSQHDPGLRHLPAQPSDYSQRYVLTDIIESASFERENINEAHLNEKHENISVISDQKHESLKTRTASAVDNYQLRRPICEWLTSQDNCVILGEPGHGKSILLRYLALSLTSKDFPTQLPINIRHLKRLPVWISFSRFTAAIIKQPSVNIEDFFCEWLHQYGYGDTRPLFLKALRTSEFVLLVDGLDEAAGSPESLEALDRIVTFGKANRAIIVCTSRPRPITSLPVPQSWPMATLAPLNDNQIKELASRWFFIVENCSSEISQKTKWSRAESRGEGFYAEIKASSRTRELAQNPLLCQALIELYRFSHRLPEARIRAYTEIMELFLRRHPEARAHAAFTAKPTIMEDLRYSDLQDILTKIAFDAQSSDVTGIINTEQSIALCAEYLEDDLVGLGWTHSSSIRKAPEIIEILVNHFGVLIERAPGELSFAHLSLQEYMAAKAVTALPEAEQLKWIQDISLNHNWYECLISWFGIQGENGRRKLAAKAIEILTKLGKNGEWERIQILSLRAEIATADLGLPVSEARKIIKEAIKEVETSPFPDFQKKLSQRIAIGALGGAIKEECEAAIARWTPGRSHYDRALLLKSFRDWNGSDDLCDTLKRALYDESIDCCRAAAESYATVYAENSAALDFLFFTAKYNLRPGVRAAALHGLMQISAWADNAAKLAEWNIKSNSPELQLTCIAMRVEIAQQTNEDLEKLITFLSSNSLDFSLKDFLHQTICKGWPRNDDLRSRCINSLKEDRGRAYLSFILEYLLSSYPNDSEVALMIEKGLLRDKFHFMRDSEKLWDLLRTGYSSDENVTRAVRDAIDDSKQKYSAIHWHPRTMPAYLVLADNQARDELLSEYRDADLQGRYWIAQTLLKGWPHDPIVQQTLKAWAEESVDLASPLAKFSHDIKPLETDRLTWLENLVYEANARILPSAIYALLEQRPDSHTHSLIINRLENSNIWYYHRKSIESKLAATYPNCEHCRQIVEKAFTEPDGPHLAILANAYQDDLTIRPRLLAAAAPASRDVRLSIASTLRERSGSLGLLKKLTYGVFREEISAIRAASLIALARAYKYDADHSDKLLETLTSEAVSIGAEMDIRRRTAIAALLEVGEVNKVVKILHENKPSSHFLWSDIVDRDLVSIGVILDHWPEIKKSSAALGLSIDLPVTDLIGAGYGLYLERVLTVRSYLHEITIQEKENDFYLGKKLEILSHLHPKSSVLRLKLLKVLGKRAKVLPKGKFTCLAARILGEHFGGDFDTLSHVIPEGTLPDLTSGSPGVLGHLVRSWPESEFAVAARTIGFESRESWSHLDRLICSTAWEYWDEASIAAREIIDWRYHDGYIEHEEIQALRIWAKSVDSLDVLLKWRESSDGNEAVAALMLLENRMGMSQEGSIWLKSAFNQIMEDQTKAPTDGFDPSAGHVLPWSQKAYKLLSQ